MQRINKKLFPIDNQDEEAIYEDAYLEFDMVNYLLLKLIKN